MAKRSSRIVLTVLVSLHPSTRAIRAHRSGQAGKPWTILRLLSLPTTPDLARIPAGEFLMGAGDGEDDERPVHRAFVSEFFISRFPVTVDEYARFVRATGYPAPAVRGLPLIAAEHEDL